MAHQSSEIDLVFGLDDKPGVAVSMFSALQHVLANFIGIITSTLIIGGVLGLGSEVPYLVSMALIVAGIGSFIQAHRIGPVGSGLLCVQGTSFAFLSSILAAGLTVKGRGGAPEEILSTIFGVCFLGAFVEIFLSRFIDKLKRIITPVVTGTITTLIMVGTVAMAGIKIISQTGLNRRNMLITAIPIGLGVALVPEVLSAMPATMKNIIGSPLTIGSTLTIGALSAIILSLILPVNMDGQDEEGRCLHKKTICTNVND